MDAAVCAVLLQSQGLEITLSAYVETQTHVCIQTCAQSFNQLPANGPGRSIALVEV